MSVDHSLFSAIHNLAGKSQVLDFLGVFFADYLGYLILLFVILLIFRFEGWRKRIYYFSLLGLTAIISRGIITEFIRFFYHRPRPFAALEFIPLIDKAAVSSFPSGHTALYLAVILPVFLIKKSLGWYLTGAVVLMGAARVFAGVHWPLDILGGIIVAVVSFYVVYKYLLKGLKENLPV